MTEPFAPAPPLAWAGGISAAAALLACLVPYFRGLLAASAALTVVAALPALDHLPSRRNEGDGRSLLAPVAAGVAAAWIAFLVAPPSWLPAAGVALGGGSLVLSRVAGARPGPGGSDR